MEMKIWDIVLKFRKLKVSKVKMILQALVF